MKKVKFTLSQHRGRFDELGKHVDQKTLALWAIDCTERVLPYFESHRPDDNRPRQAIETLLAWLETGVFSMKVVRKAALDSHAAARDVGEDNAARSAARAAGQALGTAHVPEHAMGAAMYALQAIHRATEASQAYEAVIKERDWQYSHLLQLKGDKT